MKKVTSLICALLCVIIFTVFAGCSTPCSCGRDLPCNHLSGEEAFARYRASVVEIFASNERGSGIIIERDGDSVVVASCYHLCGSDLTSVSVRFYGKEKFEREGITLLGYDARNDLTIFKVRASGFEGVGKKVVKASEGESVFCLGNSDGDGIAISEGVVSLTDCVEKYDRSNYYKPLVRTTAPTSGGNSGGLVVGRESVVGMSVAKSEQFSFTLPYEIVIALYQNAQNGGIQYPAYSIASGDISEDGLLKKRTTITLDGVEYIFGGGALSNGDEEYEKINGEKIADTLSGVVAQIVKTEGERVELS